MNTKPSVNSGEISPIISDEEAACSSAESSTYTRDLGILFYGKGEECTDEYKITKVFVNKQVAKLGLVMTCCLTCTGESARKRTVLSWLRWRAPEELLEYFSVTYPELPPSEVFQELDTTGSEVTLLLSWRYTSKGLKEGDSADRKTFILNDFPLGKRMLTIYRNGHNNSYTKYDST